MASKNVSAANVISLPQGGGALKGLGEKFSPDLFTGTGNFTIPIILPPGRNGFQPQVSLSFSTGTGNGAFGLGWSLGIPGVARKTSKGIPRYRDNPDSQSFTPDVFILSGAEDLVPVEVPFPDTQRYRPRTEGLFALIDHVQDANNDYWKVQTKDGLHSYYGTPNTAGADPTVVAKPADRHNIFAWRLSRTEDTFGNRIEYTYLRDQDAANAQEADQLHPRQIRYVDFTAPDGTTRYLVTVDFLYDNDAPPPGANAAASRPDPFSEFQSGFQMRTRRRCKWIVVKTHPTAGREQLVRTYELVYLDERTDLPDLAALLPANGVSLLSQVDLIGYDDNNYPARELPPLELSYSRFEPWKRTFSAVTGRALPPVSLGHPDYELVDLFGNGLPDILEMNDSVRYWRNLGGGRFDLPRAMTQAPAGLRLADNGVQLIDANGDGRIDLLVTTTDLSGYYPLTFNGGWDHKKSFQRYRQSPTFNLEDPEVRLIDLDGDGVTDAIRAGTRLECYFNDPIQGWQPGSEHVRHLDRPDDGFPANFSDPRVKWADMTGGGLQDVALIHNRRVDYWPSLGYGNFGARVTMLDSPILPLDYDPRRLLVGDVDGDGLADIVYVENRQLTLWINQSGNGWSAPIVIRGTPAVSDMDSVRLTDLHGTSVSGVLWTQDVRANGGDHYFFFDFTGGVKSYLLTEMDNHIGAVTKVAYASSTGEYLRDQADTSLQWRTPLPFSVQVVARVEVIDAISGGKLTTDYRYHHGYWDGTEREFRGFGMVEHCDTESFAKYSEQGLHGSEAFFASVDRKYFSPPVLTKNWFHQGPVGEEFGDWNEADYADEYWSGDPSLLDHATAVDTFLSGLSPRRVKRDALRTLRGSMLRSEVYALDGSALEDRPYTITENAYSLREEASPSSTTSTRERVFFPHRTAQRTTQWERGDDPLVEYSFTDRYDAFGQALSQSTLAMPRRAINRLPTRSTAIADKDSVLATHTRTVYAEPDVGIDRAIRHRVAQSTGFTFANKPQLTETQQGDVRAVLRDQLSLAKSLHQQCESDLRHWQAIQGNVGNYHIFSHVLNYYDGAAYVGATLGRVGRYGVSTRTESLALTDAILDRAYNEDGAQHRPIYLGGTATPPIGSPADFGADHGYLDKRSGIAGYVPGYYVSTQQQKFDFQSGSSHPRGLPVAMRDALNHESTIDEYDPFQFLALHITDPKGMSVHAEYNLRVLAPRKITDPNGNVTAVAFTPAGLVGATWVKGKSGEGDSQEPGSRIAYDFLAFRRDRQPIHVRTIKRVLHDTDPDDTGETIESRDYSDGFGRTIQTRAQGETLRFGDARFGGGASVLPADQDDGRGDAVVALSDADAAHPNVVVSAWQIFDNKGKIVEKYEPFFSTGWVFEPEQDARHGEHTELFYDPRGQMIRSVNPDGSEQRVVTGVPNQLDDPLHFSPTPWETYTYDPNDNAGRTHDGDATVRGYAHHWNTPTSTAVDALGRTVRAVVRHRTDIAAAIEEHVTESEFDIDGNLLFTVDALGRAAFRHAYDLGKHTLRTESIDAGRKLVVLDAGGKSIEGHDAKGAIALHIYDALNRSIQVWARDADGDPVTLREKLIYGDDAGVGLAAEHNLLGRLYQYYDEAGLASVTDYDFKGNVVSGSRQLISDDFLLVPVRAHHGADWSLIAPRVDWAAPPGNVLDAHAYQTVSAFDALNRIKWSEYPQVANGERYRLKPTYNRAGALEQVALAGPLDGSGPIPSTAYVQRLAYNAKGQRILVVYGNGLMTRYAYDPKTFRLARMRTDGYTQPTSLSYQPQSAPLQDCGYDYDLTGNILRITDRTAGSGVRNNPQALIHPALRSLLAAGDALVRDFSYDPLYRLVSATGRECSAIADPRPTTDDARCGYNSGRQGAANQDNAPDLTSLYEERYGYDPAGNMLALTHRRNGANGWSRHFGMSGFAPKAWRDKVTDFINGNAPNWGTDGNRLSNFGNADDQLLTHRYDANGNMTQENGERHFEWDHANRMKVFRIQNGSGKPSVYALYLYDAAGQRIKKLVVTGTGYRTTTYLGVTFEHHADYDKLDGSGKKENCSLHVMDDKQRIALLRVGAAFDDDGIKDHPMQYHLDDHLGSSAIVVSGNGAWINREEYFPYGETSLGSYGRKRYRFTGKERDEESGLNHVGARYYSLSLCRWQSTDPAGAIDGLNLFRFCRDNPFTLRDVSGMDSDVNGTPSPPPTSGTDAGTHYVDDPVAGVNPAKAATPAAPAAPKRMNLVMASIIAYAYSWFTKGPDEKTDVLDIDKYVKNYAHPMHSDMTDGMTAVQKAEVAAKIGAKKLQTLNSLDSPSIDNPISIFMDYRCMKEIIFGETAFASKPEIVDGELTNPDNFATQQIARKGYVWSKEYDAFGHCYGSCEVAKKCGPEVAIKWQREREVWRESGIGGKHDSPVPDIHNGYWGIWRSLEKGDAVDCKAECTAGFDNNFLDLSAPNGMRFPER